MMWVEALSKLENVVHLQFVAIIIITLQELVNYRQWWDTWAQHCVILSNSVNILAIFSSLK